MKYYSIQGVLRKGKRTAEVNATCKAYDRDMATFVFGHDPRLIGVKLDWRTLKELRVPVRQRRKGK